MSFTTNMEMMNKIQSDDNGSIKTDRIYIPPLEYIQIKEKYLKYFSDLNDIFFEKIKFSMKCIDNIFSTYSNNNKDNTQKKIFVSFNGGKDCLAAYILIKYYFYCKFNNIQSSEKSSFLSFCEKSDSQSSHFKISEYNIEFIYFLSNKTFTEEEDYVIKFSKKEEIISKTFYIYSDYITGLKFLIKNFELNMVIMGTRKDDILKYNSVVVIDKELENNLIHVSTFPYPNFNRFYPIFNFDFDDIWRLILMSKMDYLPLYDKGFSSIGNKHNTKVNENLRFDDSFVLPSWCLQETISERSFRK